jgi:spore coat protein CotF
MFNNQGNEFQQNIIQNPSTMPEAKNPDLNDRDYVNDILANEKYLTDSINVFAREASHNELYNDIKMILNETHDCARDIFNTMFQEGMYELQIAPQQEIQQTHQQFSNYLNSQDPYRGF